MRCLVKLAQLVNALTCTDFYLDDLKDGSIKR